MKIGYGIEVQESDDPYISIAEDVLGGIAQAGIPGSFWVDLFPVLQYVPSWFPAAGFQKKAARWKEATNTMAEKPFRHVQEQMVYNTSFFGLLFILITILQKIGKASPSMAATLIDFLPDEDDPQRSNEEAIARNVTFVAYVGACWTQPILDVR